MVVRSWSSERVTKWPYRIRTSADTVCILMQPRSGDRGNVAGVQLLAERATASGKGASTLKRPAMGLPGIGIADFISGQVDQSTR